MNNNTSFEKTLLGFLFFVSLVLAMPKIAFPQHVSTLGVTAGSVAEEVVQHYAWLPTDNQGFIWGDVGAHLTSMDIEKTSRFEFYETVLKQGLRDGKNPSVIIRDNFLSSNNQIAALECLSVYGYMISLHYDTGDTDGLGKIADYSKRLGDIIIGETSASAGVCRHINSELSAIARRIGLDSQAISVDTRAAGHVVAVVKTGGKNSPLAILDYGRWYCSGSTNLKDTLAAVEKQYGVITLKSNIYDSNGSVTGFCHSNAAQIIISSMDGETDFSKRLHLKSGFENTPPVDLFAKYKSETKTRGGIETITFTRASNRNEQNFNSLAAAEVMTYTNEYAANYAIGLAVARIKLASGDEQTDFILKQRTKQRLVKTGAVTASLAANSLLVLNRKGSADIATCVMVESPIGKATTIISGVEWAPKDVFGDWELHQTGKFIGVSTNFAKEEVTAVATIRTDATKTTYQVSAKDKYVKTSLSVDCATTPLLADRVEGSIAWGAFRRGTVKMNWSTSSNDERVSIGYDTKF